MIERKVVSERVRDGAKTTEDCRCLRWITIVEIVLTLQCVKMPNSVVVDESAFVVPNFHRNASSFDKVKSPFD